MSWTHVGFYNLRLANCSCGLKFCNFIAQIITSQPVSTHTYGTGHGRYNGSKTSTTSHNEHTLQTPQLHSHSQYYILSSTTIVMNRRTSSTTATTIALWLSIAFAGAGATDLKLNVLQEGTTNLVPIDEDFTFFCGRAEDLNKKLSDIELFETMIDEDGHPRCIGVKNEVAVIAYHPKHGYCKQKVDIDDNRIRGSSHQDVVITLERRLMEQDMARRRGRRLDRRDDYDYDIVRYGQLPYRRFSSIDSTDTITLVQGSKSSKSVPSVQGIPKDCVVKDIDVQVTVAHSFASRTTTYTLTHDSTTEVLDSKVVNGRVDTRPNAADFFDDEGSIVATDLSVTTTPGLANFEGQPAVGDWTLDLDYNANSCGGVISWGLFINCARSSKSAKSSSIMSPIGDGEFSQMSMSMMFEEEDWNFPELSSMSMDLNEDEDDNEDEEAPMTRMHPVMKAKVAHCFGVGADEITEDSYKNMDDATMDCVREVFDLEQEQGSAVVEQSSDTGSPTPSPTGEVSNKL